MAEWGQVCSGMTKRKADSNVPTLRSTSPFFQPLVTYLLCAVDSPFGKLTHNLPDMALRSGWARRLHVGHYHEQGIEVNDDGHHRR